MAKRSETDIQSDAPPSALKDPNPAAAGLSIDPDDSGDLIGRTVTINVPRQALYAFWRDFRNLPTTMPNLESVTVQSDTRSHWVVKGPTSEPIEWHAEIVEDRLGEMLSWRTLEGSNVPNQGEVHFCDAPAGRGTGAA